MASVNFNNAKFQINATDLSAFLRAATLNYGTESLDDTNMGDTTRLAMGGLKTWSMDLTFTQDFVAAGVDGTLFNLVGTTACVELRPVNACSSANNPTYSGIGIIMSYPPLGGAVGTHLEAGVTIAAASTLTRASSS